MLPLPVLALWLAAASSSALGASKAGTFESGGETKVSAMMMFLGNDEKVYILDKAEGNQAQINGHPAWGAVWDIKTRQTEVMDVKTNVFCASGMHLPNGSYATFGGNGAIGPGGNIGSVRNQWGSGAFDETYQDLDGTKAIRIIKPCKSNENFGDSSCQWFDDPTTLSMQKQRWYSAAEALGDGTIALIGGFVNGGYVNRNWPDVEPGIEGGAAESSYEFYPSKGPANPMPFLIKTSGLNSYAHSYLLRSGKMLVQAKTSTILWDPASGKEEPLPDMPKGVVRVYPASGAVAMLPLTPENDYNPTVLFCGGSDMKDEDFGNYSYPFINTWNYPASADCQRITPEPLDGSAVAYEQDDDMLETRSMGQFLILPDGKMLVVNGALNGTAGYATATLQTPDYGQMPFGMSLASGPVGRPAIYDPSADKGKRWSNAGLGTSQIARMYHSSAIVLPDASVLIAGSNPNVDVNISTAFPTEYRAEVFYPPYFSATTRPQPKGLPTTLSYGGASFDVTIPASSYSGSSNDAADKAFVSVLRTGWTTHGMNMGQRFLKLKNTYTVKSDGSIVLHVAQMPPIANIFQPGPAFIHVVVNGIPSVGSYAIVGNGQMGTQPTAAEASLPANVRVDSAKGSADGSKTGNGGNGTSDSSNGSSSSLSKPVLYGAIAGGVLLVLILGTVAFCFARRRRARGAAVPSAAFSSSLKDPDMSGMGQGATYGRPGGNGYTLGAGSPPQSPKMQALGMGAYGDNRPWGAAGPGSPRASSVNLVHGHHSSPSFRGSEIDNRSIHSTGPLINRADTASPYDPYRANAPMNGGRY